MNGRRTHNKAARPSAIYVRGYPAALIVADIDSERHSKVAMLAAIRAASGHRKRFRQHVTLPLKVCQSSAALSAIDVDYKNSAWLASR